MANRQKSVQPVNKPQGAVKSAKRKTHVEKPTAAVCNHSALDSLKVGGSRDGGVTLQEQPGISSADLVAALIVTPGTRHADVGLRFGGKAVSNLRDHCVSTGHLSKVLAAVTEKLRDGDSAILVDLLAAQALTLDAVSTDLLLRASLSDGFDHHERLLRMAMKAQANSRATVEALAKLMRGGEQVVKHVHVYEGGQAVVADTFNHGGLPGVVGGRGTQSA